MSASLFNQLKAFLRDTTFNTSGGGGSATATDIYTPDFAIVNASLSEIAGSVEHAGATDMYSADLSLLQTTLSEVASSVEHAGATNTYAASIVDTQALIEDHIAVSELIDEDTTALVAQGIVLQSTVSEVAGNTGDLIADLSLANTTLSEVAGTAADIYTVDSNTFDLIDEMNTEVQQQSTPISYAANRINATYAQAVSINSRLSTLLTQTLRLQRNGGGNVDAHTAGRISTTTTVVNGKAGESVQMRNFMLTHDGADPIRVRIKSVNDSTNIAPVNFYLPGGDAQHIKMDPSNWYFETATSDGLQIHLTLLGGSSIGNVYYSIGYYRGAAESLPK